MKPQLNITLRRWVKEDFQTVRNILLVTWKNTYSFIPEKDIITHLDNFYSKPKLHDLYDNPAIIGILASLGTEPVGWMKLFEDKLTNRFYVSSLYVLPDYQGFGIGKKLFIEAEKIAEKFKHDRVWLGVMKENKNALKWYHKLGFRFIEEEPFKMGETEVLHLIGYKII